MPNITGILRDEIRRLAKREVKSLVGNVQKATVQCRRDIAQLKRLVKQQDRDIKRLKRQDKSTTEEKPLEGIRYSARSVRAQRKRLGLSAADYGKLIGVSGLTIYHWEHRQARPRKSQIAALVAVRNIGLKEAKKRLAEEASRSVGTKR